MSENERLREVLEIVRVNCNTWSERKLSTEADRKTFAWLARRASNALDAEPETCVWTHHPNYTYTRSCDGRKTQFMPGSYMNGADFETDTICSGCGAKIEVRS